MSCLCFCNLSKEERTHIVENIFELQRPHPSEEIREKFDSWSLLILFSEDRKTLNDIWPIDQESFNDFELFWTKKSSRTSPFETLSLLSSDWKHEFSICYQVPHYLLVGLLLCLCIFRLEVLCLKTKLVTEWWTTFLLLLSILLEFELTDIRSLNSGLRSLK